MMKVIDKVQLMTIDDLAKFMCQNAMTNDGCCDHCWIKDLAEFNVCETEIADRKLRLLEEIED